MSADMVVVEGIRYSVADLAAKEAREAAAAARAALKVAAAVSSAIDTDPSIEDLRTALEAFAGTLADLSDRMLVVEEALVANGTLVDFGDGGPAVTGDKIEAGEITAEKIAVDPVAPAAKATRASKKEAASE